MKDFILKKHAEVQEEKELITKAIEDAKAETDSKGIKLVNDLEHRKKVVIITRFFSEIKIKIKIIYIYIEKGINYSKNSK